MDNNTKRDSISIYTSEINKLKQEIQSLKEKNASLERKELVYAQRFIRNSVPNMGDIFGNKGSSNEDENNKINNTMNSSINDLMKKYETKNDDLSIQLITITDKLKQIVETKDQIEVLKIEINQLNINNQNLKEQLAQDDQAIQFKNKDIENFKKNNQTLEEKISMLTKELEEKNSRIEHYKWGCELKKSKIKTFDIKTNNDNSNKESNIQSSIHKFKNEILIEIRNLISDKGNEVKFKKQNSITSSNNLSLRHEEVLIDKMNQLTAHIINMNNDKEYHLKQDSATNIIHNNKSITLTTDPLVTKDNNIESLLDDGLLSFDDYTLETPSDLSTLFTQGWECQSNSIYTQESLREFTTTKVASIALLSNCNSNLMLSFICQLTNRKYAPFLSLSNIHFKYLIEDQPPLLIAASIISHYPSLTSLLIDKFMYQCCTLPIFFTNLLSHTNIEYLLRIISNNSEKKELFVIHDLSCFNHLSNIEDYIKNYLLNGVFSPNIKKTFMLSLKKIKMKTNKNYWFYSDCLTSCKINHLIIAKDNTEVGDYYNETTFKFLIKTIHLLPFDNQFVIEDQMFKFIQNNFVSSLMKISNEPIMIPSQIGYVKLNRVYQNEINFKLNSLNELNYYDSLIENFAPEYSIIILNRRIQIVIEINDLVTNLSTDIHPIESISSDDKNKIYSFEIKGEKLLKYSPMYFLESKSNLNNGLSFSNRRSGRFCLRFDYKIPKKLIYLLDNKGVISYELGMLLICFE